MWEVQFGVLKLDGFVYPHGIISASRLKQSAVAVASCNVLEIVECIPCEVHLRKAGEELTKVIRGPASQLCMPSLSCAKMERNIITTVEFTESYCL